MLVEKKIDSSKRRRRKKKLAMSKDYRKRNNNTVSRAIQKQLEEFVPNLSPNHGGRVYAY